MSPIVASLDPIVVAVATVMQQLLKRLSGQPLEIISGGCLREPSQHRRLGGARQPRQSQTCDKGEDTRGMRLEPQKKKCA